LRETDVQQPNTTSTFSPSISSRAFSANSGQSEAGSTTTASSGRPSRPPLAFCSSISISITSFSVVSLIAMVPEREHLDQLLRLRSRRGHTEHARSAEMDETLPRRGSACFDRPAIHHYCLQIGQLTVSACEIGIRVASCPPGRGEVTWLPSDDVPQVGRQFAGLSPQSTGVTAHAADDQDTR
jgi:hypothetical protein